MRIMSGGTASTRRCCGGSNRPAASTLHAGLSPAPSPYPVPTTVHRRGSPASPTAQTSTASTQRLTTSARRLRILSANSPRAAPSSQSTRRAGAMAFGSIKMPTILGRSAPAGTPWIAQARREGSWSGPKATARPARTIATPRPIGSDFLSVSVGCRQHENRRFQQLTVTAEPLRASTMKG